MIAESLVDSNSSAAGLLVDSSTSGDVKSQSARDTGTKKVRHSFGYFRLSSNYLNLPGFCLIFFI